MKGWYQRWYNDEQDDYNDKQDDNNDEQDDKNDEQDDNNDKQTNNENEQDDADDEQDDNDDEHDDNGDEQDDNNDEQEDIDDDNNGDVVPVGHLYITLRMPQTATDSTAPSTQFIIIIITSCLNWQDYNKAFDGFSDTVD